MGLDAVELVLRTEDLFAISLTDEEASAVRTVGDFYRLVCAKLDVTPLAAPITSPELPTLSDTQTKYLVFRSRTRLPCPPKLLPWTAQSAWDALVALFVDQLGLEPEEALYTARIAEDLGVD